MKKKVLPGAVLACFLATTSMQASAIMGLYDIVSDPTNTFQNTMNNIITQTIDQVKSQLEQALRKAGFSGAVDIFDEILTKAEGSDPRLLEYYKKVSKYGGECSKEVTGDTVQGAIYEQEVCNNNTREREKYEVDRAGVTNKEQSVAGVQNSRKAAGIAANNIYETTAAQGVELLEPKGTEQVEKEFVDAVHAKARVTADGLISDANQRLQLSRYLTLFPVVPVGNTIAESKGGEGDWFESEPHRDLLAKALVGIREVSVSSQKTLNEGGYFLQAEKYKKYARMQLAKMEILQSMDPNTILLMRQMFLDYVMKPGVKELGGYDENGKEVAGYRYSTEQLLQLQIRQSQAINWNLLELRRLAMESNRIQAVILAVMEDGTGNVGGNNGGMGASDSGGSGKVQPNAAPMESFELNQ